ncbi:MAG: ascorbate-dependent monooxygenase [Bryobacteraceae bacterium]
MKQAIAALALLGASAMAAPTFNKDIAPILYQNCSTCHRPGEVAPFALLTYRDAAKRAGLIATVTQKRYMPPWKPEPGFGKFDHERRLTDEQIALIQEWAAAGAPEGNPADKIEPPTFPSGWQAGLPDQALKMSAPYSLPADGPDQFRCFVIPMNLDKEAYVSGAEFRPGNPRVVHHAIVFLDSSGTARRLAAASGGSGYPCFGGPGFGNAVLLVGWAPGATPLAVDSAISQPVRPGTDVVVQIHYHPSGKPEQDQSSLGLKFSGPPSKGRALLLVFNRNIDIPAGDSHYVLKGSITMPQDGELWGITPHAHYLAQEMKITARMPDGSVTPLIYIKDWDFNWQGQYTYTEPIKLPKGTRIEMEFTYDNSADNPHNPSNPPVRVRFGEQTKDEMGLAFLGIVLPSPADVQPFQRAVAVQYVEDFLATTQNLNDLPEEIPPALAQRLSMALRVFDRNGDGKLDAQERAAALLMLRTLMQ